MLVKNLLAVAAVLVLAACTSARKEAPASSAQGGAQPVPAAATRPVAPASSAPSAASSSAYLGCGRSIPPDKLWDETTEGEVQRAIEAATVCAASHGRRLLLEFVAPWCADCQEMARLDETNDVRAVMNARFERVRVNVGKWDRHEALRRRFDVRALATYIVIDPKTSNVLAKTTLEPISKSNEKLSPDDWARWLAAH